MIVQVASDGRQWLLSVTLCRLLGVPHRRQTVKTGESAVVVLAKPG